MTRDHVTQAEGEATQVANPQSEAQHRPRVRRLAMIRTGGSRFRLDVAAAEVAS